MAADEKKKSLAALIIAGAPKPKGAGGSGMDDESGEDESKESDGDAGLESAADEIISAIEQKDSGALVEALKSFMAMC